MINQHNLALAKQHLQEIFIQNGGGNMYNYTIGADVTKEVLNLSNQQNKKKKVDDLLNQIGQIHNTFSGDGSKQNYQENVSLERKTFTPKTQSEVEELAKNELITEKNNAQKTITDQNSVKKAQLLEQKEVQKNTTQATKESLQSAYDQAKQNANDEALKRGLARSSIVVNQLNAFDQDQLEKYSKLDEELQNNINAIEFELSGLEGELQQALNDFNVTYASKLQSKMNELNFELTKQKESSMEYNNEIALKEAEFNKKLAELNNELSNTDFEKGTTMLDLMGKYGSNIVNKYVSDNVYQATKKYLSKLSKAEALEVLQDQKVKASLGSMYETLLKEFS